MNITIIRTYLLDTALGATGYIKMSFARPILEKRKNFTEKKNNKIEHGFTKKTRTSEVLYFL